MARSSHSPHRKSTVRRRFSWRSTKRWLAQPGRMRALRVLAVLLILYPLTSGEPLPVQRDDLCGLFVEKPKWHTAIDASARRWNVSIGLQMAILQQESDFYSKARPPRERLWGFIPWRRPSTAYGYGQVLDSTWDDFRQLPGRSVARRDRFDDVSAFMGWYLDRLHHTTGVAKDDAYGLYLAYHEGPGGYARGSYRPKAWLQRVARQVVQQGQRYDAQLATCGGGLQRRRWLRLAVLWLGTAGLVTWLWRSGRFKP